MKIAIQALDTLFFRDGKPFDKGNETWANGVFPPMPSVFYGALRTAYLSENDIDLKEAKEKTKTLEIKNIFLHIPKDTESMIRKKYYLPMPLDLVMYKGETTASYLKLCKLPPHAATSGHSEYVLQNETARKIEELAGNGLVNLYEFQEFYQYENKKKEVDALKPIRPEKIKSFLTSEPKIGIARNNYSHTTEENMLYRVAMQRPENDAQEQIHFLIDFEKLDLKNTNGFLKLGGEGKVTTYQCMDEALSIPLPVLTTNCFKVYLATPAIFENGWYPSILANKTIAHAIGKPQLVGGFDMQTRMPKAMQRAVPAGSVYYVQMESVSAANELAQQLHGHSISEYRQNEGFGICYIAQINQSLD